VSDALLPELCVLLTPRSLGGHETALFGWLADAVRNEGLNPGIVAPTPELKQACDRAGLSGYLMPWAEERAGRGGVPSLKLLAALQRWPADRPLLLAPGVLHSSAWLLAAAVTLRRAVWVYVPMTHSAQRMKYRWAALRDAAIAPWLRRVEGWITIDEAQARQLNQLWRVTAPIHVLPNVARLEPSAPSATLSPSAGLRRETGQGLLRVVFLGRFDLHQKGLDWLVEVLRARPPWALNCHWSFQGRGPGEPLLQELASALGPHRVQILPFGPIEDALAENDVLLLPSRYEGVPLVALEAASHHVPVVASRETELEPLLPRESLFSFGDDRGLQAALESLRDAEARSAAASYTRSRILTLLPLRRYHRARRNIVRALQCRTALP
jgi:glycosyltransferase involved in cell wall biosynthesis